MHLFGLKKLRDQNKYCAPKTFNEFYFSCKIIYVISNTRIVYFEV